MYYRVHSGRRINGIRRISFAEERANRIHVEYKDKSRINNYEFGGPEIMDAFMADLQRQLMALNIGMKPIY